MAAGVDGPVDDAGGGFLRVQMFGSFAIHRGERAVALPASRKLRALLAYLALAPRPVGRSPLCELLWDGPNDPRGELRNCLSKIRGAIETPQRPRVIVREDAVQLDLQDAQVDVLEVERAIDAGLDALPVERKRALAALFTGDFLQGLELEDCPRFDGWLAAQRRRFRGCQAALLEQLSQASDDDQALGYLDRWLQLSPFDRRAHEQLLQRLARLGRLREGEEHLAAAATLFGSEGLDVTPLRSLWRDSLAQHRAGTPTQPVIALAAEPRIVPPHAPHAPHPASIAVMPFVDPSSAPRTRGDVADALAYDVTVRLSKLRSLFVISQGSAFALHERRIGPEEAGRMLNVEYVVSGTARHIGGRLSVAVELVETRSARVVWSEMLNQKLDDAFQVLEDIGNRIVASIAGEIETIERNRAVLRPPNSLSAWEMHHRGLSHMYRFTQADNALARQCFEAALQIDPAFSRAHAALSFTWMQEGFQGWESRATAAEKAYAAASRSLLADDRDPAAHGAMGRALWLGGRNAAAIEALERAIDLSPSYSLAHYMIGFVQGQAGNPAVAIMAADRARSLSPFDPLMCIMLASRAIALAQMGRYTDAAEWAVKAAARPNAHVHLQAIAAYCLVLADSIPEARPYAETMRRMVPGYSIANFLSAYHFDDKGIERFRQAAKRLGTG